MSAQHTPLREQVAAIIYARSPHLRIFRLDGKLLNRGAEWDEATADERVEAYEDADAILALPALASAPALLEGHQSQRAGLQMLLMAIEADDPKAELHLRVRDLIAEADALVSLAEGEG